MTKGALAQLGERLICIQEVVGSIPSGSTKFFANFFEKRALLLRKFGWLLFLSGVTEVRVCS